MVQDAQEEGSEEPIVLEDDDDDDDNEDNEYGDDDGDDDDAQHLQPDQSDAPGTWQYAEAEFVQEEEAPSLQDLPIEGGVAEVCVASYSAPVHDEQVLCWCSNGNGPLIGDLHRGACCMQQG